MYGMNLLLTFNKTLAVKVKTVISSLHFQRNSSKAVTSFNIRSHVDKDVVLFNFEKPKFFILVNVFSAVQCFFWTYLGLFLFQTLSKTNIDLESPKQVWSKILAEERKHSTILSVISIVFGWSILGATCLYSFRSIRKIILHRGGRDVTIITYSLPGYNAIKVPLVNVSEKALNCAHNYESGPSQMSSFEHRTKAKKFIPIKLKNKLFFYLVDKRGEFSNPALFDCTAGIKRTL